ncbi:MAG TPA: PD-(D/E)XK nuclease family protein, partial [Candidatus Binatia bacterium]|nr:PD-(D/E)XK nuclease family protein [Candidatus Binatia bacterium]
QHVAAFRTTLRRLGLRPVAPGPLPPATAWRDACAWERLVETLDALAGVSRALGGRPIELVEFPRLLVAALEPLAIEEPTRRPGAVRALSVLDARGLDFDVVWLLGLDDGTFPAPRAESPLWPDAMKREASRLAAERLRQKLGPRGEGLPLGGVLRTAREASLEDPFLFFLALSMPEHELVVSYPAVNEQGNPTVPSPFLDEIRSAAAVPEERLDPTRLVPDATDACEPGELVARAAHERWSRRPGAPPDRLTSALAEADGALAARAGEIDRRATIEERRTRYFLSPRDGAAKAALADAYVGRLGTDLGRLPERLAAMRWSPHRLEALGACGFKFYARHVLGLDDADEPEAAVDRAERGRLVHDVLARLFTEHERLPADLAAARTLARTLLVARRDAMARAIPAKDPALLDVALGQIAATVDRLVVRIHAEQAACAAAGTAVTYTLEKAVETVLDANGEGPPVLIAGIPDRVEVWRDHGRATRLRVLDYKMSRDTSRYGPLLDPEREMGRTGFQIPVYLLAATAAVADLAPDAIIEGGYHVLLADEPLVEPTGRDVLDLVAERIHALVARARAGRFDVDPAPCDPYCRFRPVCRYQRPPLEDEASGE